MAAKGRARDKSMSKLGNRMISTMLKNEKLAEKELEKKMKALKDLERKSMVKICETSLDLKYDFRRKRNMHEMEEQLSEDPLNVNGLGPRSTLRSPSVSRRGSLVEAKQEESDGTASPGDIQEPPNDASTRNPAILINSESKEAGNEQDPESRRSSVGNDPCTPWLSPCASPCSSPPPEEPAVDEAESQNMLKVFSQSARGAQRRRSAPEILDLSPKLLIQLAKSSADIKRRGSTHDAAALVVGDEQSDATPPPALHTRRRGSASIELLQLKGELKKAEEPPSPSLRRRGSAAATNSSTGSPILRSRRSSACSKNSLSLEANEALLRDKISEQAALSPRLLKQPLSPLVRRRCSGMARTPRPLSAQPSTRDLAGPEPLLPDLKRPQSPSLRRSLSPMRVNRPMSPARSSSSLSVESTQGVPQLEAGECDLTRRRGSRPVSARSCYSMPQIDMNTLSPTSPLRKAIEDPQTTLNPAPVSPSAYRRHSVTVEALQGRVDDFLKTLAAK